MRTEASHQKRVIAGRGDGAQAAEQLLRALDPAVGLIDGVAQLTPNDPDLPRVVRAQMRDLGVAGVVHGRGASVDDALASAVSACLERQGLDELARKGGYTHGVVVGTGARVRIEARQVIAHWRGLGCAVELRDAVEHAALEACDRRALARAVAAGRFAARLDERGAPPAVARVIEWHRGLGGQVRSVLVEDGPPVVACLAVPAVSHQAVVIGIAAGRTCAEAWRSAAMEMHQVFLARARHHGGGDLRFGGVPAELGDVVALDHAIAIDRAALLRTLDETRRVVEPAAVPTWSRSIDAIAVELTTAAAARCGRRVVAVVLGEPEHGPLAPV